MAVVAPAPPPLTQAERERGSPVNCCSSVLPASAVIDEVPAAMVCVTSSK